jgi:hypothetical protein
MPNEREIIQALVQEPLAQLMARAEDKDGREVYEAFIDTLVAYTRMLSTTSHRNGAYDVLWEARSGIVGQGKDPLEVFDRISKRLERIKIA